MWCRQLIAPPQLADLTLFYVFDCRTWVLRKKICLLTIVTVVAVLWSGASLRGDDGFYVIATRGSQGPPGDSLNPLQIATLRWYECSQNGQTFTVGTSPIGVAFDGVNIWVTNNDDKTVCKR
jgi:hypothetical protein